MTIELSRFYHVRVSLFRRNFYPTSLGENFSSLASCPPTQEGCSGHLPERRSNTGSHATGLPIFGSSHCREELRNRLHSSLPVSSSISLGRAMASSCC